jgi:HlyD family secretion protein
MAVAVGAGYQIHSLLVADEQDPAPARKDSAGLKADQSSVTAVGRLEPETGIVDVGAPTGRLKELQVTAGAVVEAGAVLAYLDSYDEMLASRNHAQAQLEEALRRLQAEIDIGQANVQQARANLKYAEDVMSLQIQVQESVLCRSQAELQDAEQDLKRAIDLLANAAIPQSEYDDVALLAQQARMQIDHDQRLMEQIRQDREVKLQLARAELKGAEATTTRQRLATQVDALAAALELAETQLQRTIIRAPVRGEILKVLTRAGETVGIEPILKMGNTGSMYAIAEIYETDIRPVRVGQRATIHSDALPRAVTGRVEWIGRIIHRNDVLSLDPTARADARVIEVRIRLDESEMASRFNAHQVDIRVHTDERPSPEANPGGTRSDDK